MATTGYNVLPGSEPNPFEQFEQDFRETDNEEEQHRIVIQEVPQTVTGRWSHVQDLDKFFTRIYNYHQGHGFTVMMIDEFFTYLRLPFAFFVIPFLFSCLDFSLLSKDLPPLNHTKTTIGDIVLPLDQCMDTWYSWTWYWRIVFPIAFIVVGFRFIRFVFHLSQYYDIKQFYNQALKIPDADLDNRSWHDVQKRVLEVQVEQKICIQQNLTELDLYHRMLRFENYLVAMMNKGLIPSTIWVPGLGEIGSLSELQIYIIKFIIFWGPGSLFESNYKLKDQYRNWNRRADLSATLYNNITIVSLICILLSPMLLVWELMTLIFYYSDIIKRDPGSLGFRTWSVAGKLKLRHFNELDHQLQARLNRAYRPAVKYMESFSSPLVTVLAEHFIYFVGALSCCLLLLIVIFESLLHVEHVVTIISITAALLVMLRSSLPKENMVYDPQALLENVAAEVHYIPPEWAAMAHTTKIRDQFDQNFQLKIVKIVTKLFSPIVTPYVLMKNFRHKAPQIVDFYRFFTLYVSGVGDVCSFAQMDTRKHGHPDWQFNKLSGPRTSFNATNQAENGKTELSLLHFSQTNPLWKMGEDHRKFLDDVRSQAQIDFSRPFDVAGNRNPMTQSILALESIKEYSRVAKSIKDYRSFGYPSLDGSGQHHSFAPNSQSSMNYLGDYSSSNIRSPLLQNISEDVENDQYNERPTSADALNPRITHSLRGAHRLEGPAQGSQAGLLFGVCGYRPTEDINPQESSIADMCLSTMYLRRLYLQTKQNRDPEPATQSNVFPSPTQPQPNQFEMPGHQSTPILGHPFGSSSMSAQTAAERTPLLNTKKS